MEFQRLEFPAQFQRDSRCALRLSSRLHYTNIVNAVAIGTKREYRQIRIDSNQEASYTFRTERNRIEYE